MPTPPTCCGPLKADASVGVPGAKAPPGAKQALRLGGPGTKRRCARRTRILRDRQCPIVLDQFLCSCFENDAVIVDAVAPAHDRPALSKRVPRKPNPWPEVLRVRILLQIDHIFHPGARHCGYRGQVRTSIMGIELPVRFESYSQRRPRLRVKRSDAPVILRVYAGPRWRSFGASSDHSKGRSYDHDLMGYNNDPRQTSPICKACSAKHCKGCPTPPG